MDTETSYSKWLLIAMLIYLAVIRSSNLTVLAANIHMEYIKYEFKSNSFLSREVANKYPNRFNSVDITQEDIDEISFLLRSNASIKEKCLQVYRMCEQFTPYSMKGMLQYVVSLVQGVRLSSGVLPKWMNIAIVLKVMELPDEPTQVEHQYNMLDNLSVSQLQRRVNLIVEP